MKYTGNYNLKKPDGTDVVNIEDLNENADIIDAELKRLNDAIKDLDADGITLPDGKTISEKFEEITTEIGNTEELDTETKLSLVAAINEINQALVAHKADIASQEVGKGADMIALPDPDNLFVATNIREAMYELFTNVSNGKQLVGRAITDIDDSIVIPTDPTFQELVTAIGRISTGKKWASGNFSHPGDVNDITISGIAFKPSVVIVYSRSTSATRNDFIFLTDTYYTTTSSNSYYGFYDSRFVISSPGRIENLTGYYQIMDDGFKVRCMSPVASSNYNWVAFE